MFDLLGGQAAGDAGSVRSVMTETPPRDWNKREQLRWEKALMGLYVSDHPLTQVWSQVQHVITHTTADLKEESEQAARKKVIVAGLVSEVRSIITKTGETMAVMTLEDIQGSIEVVLFPRTWGTYRDIVEVDKVFIVRGETDLRNNEVQIRAESLDQNFRVTSAADDQLPLLSEFPPEPPADAFDEETGEKVRPPAPESPPPPEAAIAPATAGASPAQPRLQPQLTPKPNNGNGNWEEPPEFREAYEMTSYDDDDYPYDDSYYLDDEYELPPQESRRDASPNPDQAALQNHPPQQYRDRKIIPFPQRGQDSPPDRPKSSQQMGSVFETLPSQSESQPPRTLVVEMERSGDTARDRRRMRNIVGTVEQYPGKDYFCLLFKGLTDQLVRLDFPKVQTHIHDTLESELRKLEGVVRVEVYKATLDDLKISDLDDD
jgi:DNA polymerase-3 subunit alpha